MCLKFSESPTQSVSPSPEKMTALSGTTDVQRPEMLTIICDASYLENYANKIAAELRNNGCDVWIDKGYGNDVLTRCYAASNYILRIADLNRTNNTVCLLDKADDWDETTYSRRYFVNNWASLC